MTDKTPREPLFEGVLALAEKILRIVEESVPKGVFDVSPARNRHIVGMLWRARRLYEGVLLLLKAQLPEESTILARSLFETSLRLQQLAADPENRAALILGWLKGSINEYEGLLKTGKASGLDTDISAALADLEKQRQELQKDIKSLALSGTQPFLSPKDAAINKYGRKDDYWFYEFSHETVHGSQAAWIYGTKQYGDFTGLHAKTDDPVFRSTCAHFSARSISNAYSATASIFGWKLHPELHELVNQIDKLIEAHNEHPTDHRH
jgi:hypothetical protein